MDKIAIVIQRYGKGITGGAEFHARLLAEHLREHYEVDVLTSCAVNADTWENYYPKGEETEDGVKVIRFEAETKDRRLNKKLLKYLRRNYKYYAHKEYSKRLLAPMMRLLYKQKSNHDQLFEQWINAQGPCCPDLVNYLAENRNTYKTFIFFTYLYYTTYRGMEKVADKSIFIPTAHDEPAFYFSGFKKLFAQPRFIMYNTESEKQLVQNTYPDTKNIQSDIAGVGFDIPDSISVCELDKSIGGSHFFVYIGRFEKHKGTDELIANFENFKKEHKSDVKLVMIGKNERGLQSTENIIFTGFVGEEEKNCYLRQCEALIIPSRYESLSMVTLEAMAMGKPVIANAHCKVLRDHIEQSQAGYTFSNRDELYSTIAKVLSLSENEKQDIAHRGISYVDNNYRWNKIIDKFRRVIDKNICV